MLSPIIKEVRDKFLEIESEGRFPTYAGFSDGNIHILRSLQDTVLIVSPFDISLDTVGWIHKTLTNFSTFTGWIDNLLHSATDSFWAENRLRMEYALRVTLTDEYELLDERRAERVEAYFEGGISGLKCSMLEKEGDYFWVTARAVHPFYSAPNIWRDMREETPRKRYNQWFNSWLWEEAKEALNYREGEKFQYIIGNALIDAALSRCGSVYHDEAPLRLAMRHYTGHYSHAIVDAYLDYYTLKMREVS